MGAVENVVKGYYPLIFLIYHKQLLSDNYITVFFWGVGGGE